MDRGVWCGMDSSVEDAVERSYLTRLTVNNKLRRLLTRCKGFQRQPDQTNGARLIVATDTTMSASSKSGDRASSLLYRGTICWNAHANTLQEQRQSSNAARGPRPAASVPAMRTRAYPTLGDSESAPNKQLPGVGKLVPMATYSQRIPPEWITLFQSWQQTAKDLSQRPDGIACYATRPSQVSCHASHRRRVGTHLGTQGLIQSGALTV